MQVYMSLLDYLAYIARGAVFYQICIIFKKGSESICAAYYNRYPLKTLLYKNGMMR